MVRNNDTSDSCNLSWGKRREGDFSWQQCGEWNSLSPSLCLSGRQLDLGNTFIEHQQEESFLPGNDFLTVTFLAEGFRPETLFWREARRADLLCAITIAPAFYLIRK